MPSFRFLKNKTGIKKNLIYLPLNVRDTLIVQECLKFLDNNNYVDLTKFKVKKHLQKFKKNIKTKKLIEDLIRDAVPNKIEIKKIFSFIGSSGATIISPREQSNSKICDRPILDAYSDKIWSSIKKTNLNNIFIYDLKKKGDLIKLGSNFKKSSKNF